MTLPDYMSPFRHHDFKLLDTHKWGTPEHYDESDDYLPLATVLSAAYNQAARGKGKERHALGDPFLEQPIITIGQLLNSADGEAYQAIKKLREGLQMAKRGDYGSASREFLGAINYIAAVAILVAEEGHNRHVAAFEAMQKEPVHDDLSEYPAPVDDPIKTIKSQVIAAARVNMITHDRSRFLQADVFTAEQLIDSGLWRPLQDDETFTIPGGVTQAEANSLQPPAPGVTLVPQDVALPERGAAPTRDQYVYALMQHGPKSIGELNERIGYTFASDFSPELFQNIAGIAVEFDSLNDGRKRFSKAPGPALVARNAVSAWRRAELSKQYDEE